MEISENCNRVQLFEIVYYRDVLKHFLSFEENIISCNFDAKVGWTTSSLYIDKLGHDIPEHRPILPANRLFSIYGIKLTDYVILTNEQMTDFMRTKE